jgi:hypothetical protein
VSNKELAERLREALQDVRPGSALRADLVTKVFGEVQLVADELEKNAGFRPGT